MHEKSTVESKVIAEAARRADGDVAIAVVKRALRPEDLTVAKEAIGRSKPALGES